MFRTKKKPSFLSCPADGETIPLEASGDEAFAAKLLGDGIAIEPFESTFVSPCDGVVESVAKTAHAYNIATDDGLEVLIHIGIDTVELGGEGFEPQVKGGQRVKRGEILCRADVDFIRKKGYSAVTPIVITNIEDVSFFDRNQGILKRGDVLINYVM